MLLSPNSLLILQRVLSEFNKTSILVETKLFFMLCLKQNEMLKSDFLWT